MALAREKKVSLIVVGGGVSANAFLRNILAAAAGKEKIRRSVNLLLPLENLRNCMVEIELEYG